MKEETKEYTLEEGKKIYNLARELKGLVLSKFSKEELEGIINKPTQEEFDKYFEENILSQIDTTKTLFLGGKNNFSRIRLMNSTSDWLFDIDYDSKNPHFWCSYDRILMNLYTTFSLTHEEFQSGMNRMGERHFKLYGVTSYCPSIGLMEKLALNE